MVDAARLRAMLEHLAAAETTLHELRDRGADEVRGDVHLLNSAKYLFIVAAEAAIDAGQHILASEARNVPATFAGVFEELGRAGWIPVDLAMSLVPLARFRNLLVHGYAEVDDDRVVEILAGEHLQDLARFRAELTGHITG
jgi:uncharacterized protein YutE (UPF0331/DUF86 family)